MRRKTLAKHLDKYDFFPPGLLIKYHSKRPPDKDTTKKIKEAASVAGSVMRSALWQIDKVCLFFRDETDLLTQVLDRHFGFTNQVGLQSTKDAKKNLVNAKERKRQLQIIRRRMLSMSFHLNTGMYLLDTDAGHRTIVGDNELNNMSDVWSETAPVEDGSGGYEADPQNPGYARMAPKLNSAGKRTLSPQIEAYANTGTSGPVHVSFELAKTYSPLQFARLIIHEASHTFCGTTDVFYAHAEAQYYNEQATRMIENADSYAYAAVSLGSNTLHDYASLQGATYKA